MSQFENGVMNRGRASTPSLDVEGGVRSGGCSYNEISDITFGRLYNEVTVYLTRENRYAVYMGVKPVLKSEFQREMRICDGRTGVTLTVNMFQFVRMLSNFKNVLWCAEKYEAYRNSDEQYAFTATEINVPLIHIKRLTDSNSAFKISIAGQLEKFILIDENSVHQLIDMERSIIKIYRSLNTAAVQEKYDIFLSTCIGILNGKNMSQQAAKELILDRGEPDVFGTETVLKFWDLLYYNIQAELFVQHYSSI